MADSEPKYITKNMALFFAGIDIQTRRECCYAVVNKVGKLEKSGWFSDPITDAEDLIKELKSSSQVAVGIDAPRMPLISKRQWYWNGKKRQWHRRGNQTGNGRHCEIVISAHRLANPQWTPLEKAAPEWMKLGFQLYSALEGLVAVYEVFPTASYALLQGNTDIRIDADFSACKPGPKDMLDAWVAAATVREFAGGRGIEVGGGDGLGTIILPRQLPEPVIDEVLKWPELGR
jgi:predicted nuclease with RNAse H fold